MQKEKRNRKRMGFWINYDKDDELVLSETIDALKKERKYQRAIVQGIQLISSLWAGRVDVLLAMFPWIADTICQQAPPNDNSDVLRELAEMRRELHQLRQERPMRDSDIPDTRPYGVPAMKPSTAAPAPVIKSAAAPNADEIASNFLAFLQ